MSTLGVRLSKAGSMISLVCAVHCALTPLALLALPLLAAQYGGALEGVFGAVFSHSFEWVFLGVIVVVAGFGVLATYPVHGDRRPAMLTVAGFLVLLSTRLDRCAIVMVVMRKMMMENFWRGLQLDRFPLQPFSRIACGCVVCHLVCWVENARMVNLYY